MKKQALCALVLAGLTFAAPVFAEDAALEAKVDSVLAKQSEILTKLEEIKQELAVVKVRASQRG